MEFCSCGVPLRPDEKVHCGICEPYWKDVAESCRYTRIATLKRSGHTRGLLAKMIKQYREYFPSFRVVEEDGDIYVEVKIEE